MLPTNPKLFRAEVSLPDHTGCLVRTGGRGILSYFPNSHRPDLATGLLYCLSSSSCWVAWACFISSRSRTSVCTSVVKTQPHLALMP